MVRKRGFDNTYERDSIKMRRKSSRQTSPQSVDSPKEGKNSLSDGLLNLYKKEAIKLKTSENEIDSQSTNDISSGDSSDRMKICDKSLKTEKKKFRDSRNNFPENKDKHENEDNKNESRVDFDSNETPLKPFKKLKKSISKALTIKDSSITLSDCGGIDYLIEDLFESFMHITAPKFFTTLDQSPTRGILLHGPSGCGKTYLAHAIAGEFKRPIIEVTATELVSGISGDSENKIRDIFDFAISAGPCILFIDEINAIASTRETASGGMENRMVRQLARCFDELNEKDTSFNVMVIGVTNMPDSIDSTLRGGNKFDCELAIGIPDEIAKIQILKILCKNKKFAPDFDFAKVAHQTAGYVAADLKNLVRQATKKRMCRLTKKMGKPTCSSNSTCKLEEMKAWFWDLGASFENIEHELYFELCDFQEAIKEYVPLCKKEGFATVPNVTWEDIGALDKVKEELQTAIVWPVEYKEFYESNELSTTKGILLHGPKGCGKTLLAKALANECNINFLSVNGPELLNMYFGESEKAVRKCFERARNSAPCVIFFDEFDALCPSRSSSNSNAAAERVVNQLLTEMDGMQERKQVFVIAATNRKDKIDSAMLRPGRLEQQIYVGLPEPQGRIDILRRLTKNKTRPKFAEDLDLETVALDERCNGFSGADLSYLVKLVSKEPTKEAIYKFKETNEGDISKYKIAINWSHIDKVLNEKRIKPSINKKERERFEKSQESEMSE